MHKIGSSQISRYNLSGSSCGFDGWVPLFMQFFSAKSSKFSARRVSGIEWLTAIDDD